MNNLFSYLSDLLFKKENYKIFGPQGGLSTSCTLPKGFDTEKGRCPMVVLMHGFISSKRMPPIPYIAKALAEAGIASISFDFDAHGKSEGDFVDMTISNEILDAKAIYEYACSLPFVSDVALLGHSQGGVVAGMLAGELESAERKPKCLVQLAPAAVLKDDAIAGQCMGKRYDAKNPPEYVNVMFHKLGRKFILEAQQLPIYETSCKYSGNVCLIHGTNDKIVPVDYSRKYNELYPASELHILENEGHFMTKSKAEICSIITSFLRKEFFGA